jgi:hypothetical protein
MAPEQWRGDKPDGRADQYALGVLAFEMFSGVRPFRDVSMQELLRMHLNEDPPSLDTVRKGLPPRVAAAIRRAMSKEPADRFPSTTAFVAALTAGEPAAAARRAIVPPPMGSAAIGAHDSRGRQWLGNALASVMVLTAAAVGFNAWRTSRTPEPAPAVAPAADTLAARLARELEETRKIALDAQRRAERAEAEQRKLRQAEPTAPTTGHVEVLVRGGTPRLLVDGAVSAGSTPAIIEVPPGRHVIKVEEAGRQYQPAQIVIDVAEGDTSRLLFSDMRLAGRDFQPGQLPRFPRSRFADSIAAAAQQAAGAAMQGSAAPEGALPTPFSLPTRIWQNMSPQEQAMLKIRWSRMTPEQQQRAVKDIQQRDSTLVRFQRRMPQRPAAPPAP